MPRLWTDTIASHRREVRDTIIDTAATLLDERGLTHLTMSEIAERAGIGRATLYKYFSDVSDILLAWHERGIDEHLGQLAQIRDRPGTAFERLAAVLERYALIDHESHGSQSHHTHLSDPRLAAVLHAGGHMPRAQRELQAMLQDLVAEATLAGDVRHDASPGELATFCLHALAAARGLPSKAAVRRLVSVTLAGLASSGKR